MARIFIFSGPSGAGKSTIISELKQRLPNLWFSVSCTTRKPRDGEENGTDYHFITQAEFDEMINADGFLEYDPHLGASYGTPAKPLEKALADGFDAILDIETTGAANVLKKIPEAVTVFIWPGSFELLEERLRGREGNKMSEEQIASRLEKARKELDEIGFYRYTVINNILDRAVAECEAIIREERLK
ncbi:MAG: guanylate kinase [Oscillospiraceae bacterium]|jgi:guanylate kinase|nr:guanylate kinase [Oscillospiraceae bacterium]